ncbi:MAG: hypothetical protein AAGF01_02035 [Cyanobacteria bacterium P01_G01_bin.38]
MEFIYCFANASLTERILSYLLKQLRSHVKCITVLFLNDRWVVRIQLDASLDTDYCKDCWAMLNENGFPYQPAIGMTKALRDLDRGDTPISVMNRHQVVIVSHGAPNPEEIYDFRDKFVQGLGYCPQSLA